MHGPTTSPFSFLLLAALFALRVAASVLGSPEVDSSLHLEARQNQISCEDYAVIANLSTIGANSTFRAAFIQASPDATLKSSGILDNAVNQATTLALINDTALNQQCGNLSAVAIAGAPKNFSQGIVGPFNVGAAASLGSGSGMTAIVTAAIVGTAMLLL